MINNRMLSHPLERSMRRLVFRGSRAATFSDEWSDFDPPLLMVAHTLVGRDDVIWDIGADVG